MKAMKLINKKQIKTSARVAAYVGAGAIAAQAGSSIVKRASPSVAAFAAASPYKEAAVDLAAGVVAAALGHALATKIKAPGAGAAGALMLAGAMASSVAPLVMPAITSSIDKMITKILPGTPGGYYGRGTMPGALAGYDVPALPGATSGYDVPQAMAGGVASFDVPAVRRR
jgi:hypothetical protein